MLTPRSLITAITCVALVCGPVTASADPGNGNGNGNGKGNDKGGQHYDQDHGKQGGQGNKGKKSGGDDRAHGPSINRAATLEIIHGHRDYWSRSQALPPGIQKNLARGKPLPPGIAKKLDGRLASRLPHYEGYEWQQVGTELILVSIATGLVYEILNGAFD